MTGLLLEMLAGLCQRGLKFDDVSAATLFHLIDAERPTLALDEVNTYNLGSQDRLRVVLNSGHRRGGRVARAERGRSGRYEHRLQRRRQPFDNARDAVLRHIYSHASRHFQPAIPLLRPVLRTQPEHQCEWNRVPSSSGLARADVRRVTQARTESIDGSKDRANQRRRFGKCAEVD
jgi:hypothetical protein